MARYQSRQLEQADDDLDDPPTAGRPRRRWRWRLRLAMLLFIGVGVTIAAPTIIAKTPLRNILIGGLLPAEAGRLAIGDAAFTWLGSQAVAGLALVDPSAAPIVSAQQVTLERSLVGLVADRTDLGKLVVTHPLVHLDTRDGGSNLEDFIERLLAALPPSPEGQATLREVVITDGVLVGRDASTGQMWRIDRLNVTARPVEGGADWEVAGDGVLALTATLGEAPAAPATAPAGSDEPGRFKFRVHPGKDDRRQVEIMADRLPLAPIEPWLARVLPSSRLTGVASADLKAAWRSSPPADADDAPPAVEVLAAGKINATNLRFTAPALQGDLVELPAAAIAIDATLAGNRLSAAQLAIETPAATAEFHGELNLDELQSFSLDALPRTDAALKAHLDLAHLTRMLPRTLRLREGVRIDSGSIEFTAASKASAGESNQGDPSARSWTIDAAARNLVGSDGDRPIRWTQPVEAKFQAADGPDGPHLVEAAVTAAFGSLTAEAVDEGFQGKLAFNLAEMAKEVGQLVDLSAWQMQGKGTGDFTIRHTARDAFVVTSGLDLEGIDLKHDGKVVWVDPQLRLELQANGRRDGLAPTRLEAGTAFMRGPRDQLTVELLEPIELTGRQQPWFVKLTGHGPLESWAGRLRPWVAGVPQELTGQSTIDAQIRADAGAIHVVESNIAVDDLRTKIGPSLIVEPRLEAKGDFRWDAAAGAIESRDLKLTSSTLAAGIRGLSLVWIDDGPPTVRGDVAFRSDFERLAAWLGMTGVEGGLVPRGKGVGRLKLASDAQRATAELSLTAEPLEIVQLAGHGLPEAVVWSEPRLEAGASAVYATADDRLELSNLKLTGKTVELAGGGVVEQLRTAGAVRGEVNVTYDSAELAKLLASYLGPDVQLQGANQARLRAAGRLYPPPSQGGVRGGIPDAPLVSQSPAPNTHWSRRWELIGETGWSAGNVYGLPIGAARVNATVRDGQAAFSPLELAVGQGRITAQPRVLLDPPPQQLVLPGGPLASNVAISAEVSQRALKFAAPMLAGATRAEGTFSLFLEGAQIPLRQPKQGRATGRLTVHQLAVAPGPMIQDIARLLRQVEALSKPGQGIGALAGVAPAGNPLRGITMNEQTIDVQIADGRVFHRNLKFMIDDVPVESYGSVGFDETLSLVFRVPIQAKWVGSKPALQSLVGQVLEIPVSGTFAKWQVDERAIGNFLAQAAQSAASGVIGEELNKALDKLFKPR